LTGPTNLENISTAYTILNPEPATMRTVKTYATEVEANLAKTADVPSMVVGVGAEMEGGGSGVQLLVPEDCLEAARSLIERL
jgi:hypothetical protein